MKKIVSLILALVMMLSLASFASAEDKPTITMVNRLPASYVVEDNPVLAKVEEICGINLELEAPPINNYADRVSVLMASGDMPDLVYYQTDAAYLPIIQGWVNDGLVLCLNDYVDQLPTAMSVLDETALTVASIYDEEGNLYGLTRVQTKPNDAIIIRQDWLDKLGLEAPKTPEEFAAVMHAFTYDDPDGNGENDTYGFTLKGLGERHVKWAFGLVPNTVPCADGKYHATEDQEAWMTYADWLHDMYADGVIDPEWYATESYADMDSFDAGKTGSFYATGTTNHMNRGVDVIEANPGMVVNAIAPLRQNADDAITVDWYEPQMWGIWMINADLKDDPEHLAEVLKFLDWGYSDEANLLMAIGIEGITYDSFDEETRLLISSEATASNKDMYTASYATFNYQLQNKGLLYRSANTEAEGKLLGETDAKLKAETDNRSYVLDSWIPGVLDQKSALAEMNTEASDMLTKYICGNITRDDYVAYLQNTYIPAQQPMMDTITAYFAE